MSFPHCHRPTPRRTHPSSANENALQCLFRPALMLPSVSLTPTTRRLPCTDSHQVMKIQRKEARGLTTRSTAMDVGASSPFSNVCSRTSSIFVPSLLTLTTRCAVLVSAYISIPSHRTAGRTTLFARPEREAPPPPPSARRSSPSQSRHAMGNWGVECGVWLVRVMVGRLPAEEVL